MVPSNAAAWAERPTTTTCERSTHATHAVVPAQMKYTNQVYEVNERCGASMRVGSGAETRGASWRISAFIPVKANLRRRLGLPWPHGG